ncbi:hypothetical protein C7450_103147 [Chelatococcus asaccharovorans]|uniref:Uncharacterized protein n=1 Tax=Chelatococcus asaccharovorans TaxID=28210 RepID=A0A2V3UNC0_9HYPH|nr:hypothetical protein C7450_103147 [Chelatococcus asaccharovorans]
MTLDIFEYWRGVPGEARVHPKDLEVLGRLVNATLADCPFDLGCLPLPWGGPLRTARVVLLFLNPGLSAQDHLDAGDLNAQFRYFQARSGYSPLLGPDEHRPAWEWWEERTRIFGEWRHLRDKIAYLNMCPYHSSQMTDYTYLAALPSSRACLGWAQDILFPQAERGERVVICLRSSRYWGLRSPQRYGLGLFAPAVQRRGAITHASAPGVDRNTIVAAVRAAIERPPFNGITD